ncbi:MAG TPA: formaldehyde dehydrogenase, glutathione-independent [Kofleriaceae bacterium]|nr:formaldehyde dehydrogenase, glutathione-independent [Kofleriaceae bacterium]
MAREGNRGVVFLGPGKVEIQDIPYPTMQNPQGKEIDHGVILKVVVTNICGSDQHMVRGRTTARPGLILGHEITGEIVEKGRDVEFLEVGDLVTAPFNVACGRCRMCRQQETGVCLNVNPHRPGGAYGYVDMGGWAGGQAEYVLIPYADFALTRFPDKAQAMEKILDLTMTSDILPTGFHGAVNAGVGVGSTVYIAGAGPVGLAAAASAQILGAAVILVGDMNQERLVHAREVGFVPIDLTRGDDLADLIENAIGVRTVDASIDCVGFEARGHGQHVQQEAPATVLSSLMSITRVAGSIGIPGLYVTEDPGAAEDSARQGKLALDFGKGWSKSHRFYTGQTPVLKYMPSLTQAILNDRIPIARIVNATVISLEEAPKGYEDFDKGAAKKFVIDPHGTLKGKAA